jgi:glyoxylase-like metal-dependent hydrolase (beta-lactamase superfamily II)
MTRRWLSVPFVAAVALYACGPATPELQILNDAAEAMGSARAVREATSLVLEGKGRAYRLGQNRSPTSDLTYFEVASYKREIDLTNGRMRVEMVRNPAYLTGNPIFGEKVVQGLDGDVAYNVTPEGEQSRAAEQAARDRRAEMYHHPVSLIQLAIKEGSTATVSNLRQEDGQDVVDITAPTGEVYMLYVASDTKLPARVVSSSYDVNLGDVKVTTAFADYAETGGLGGFQARLRLPRQITSMVDRYTTADWRVTSDINRDTGDLAASEAVRSASPPAFAANVQVEELATGVWALTGQSHHSVLVEFPTYAVLIEAPQNETRTLAVIQKVKELVPNKPLQYLVNTHHHFDHSGGVRAAVAEGLTVITHEVNRPFFDEIVSRPHTIVADHLAKNPKPLTLQTVTGDEKFELRDGNRTLEVYRISGDLHNDGMLMIYLPRERLLIQADVFAANAREVPFAANLLKNVQGRKLQVDRIVGIHGPIATFNQLEEAAKKGAARTN